MRTLFPRPKGRFVQIRQELVQICDGDCCSAALLALFEWWTGSQLDQGGDEWLLGGRERIEEAMFGMYSGRRIQERIQALLKAGFLETRDPSGIGAERRYRLLVDAVCEAITDSSHGTNVLRPTGQMSCVQRDKCPALKDIEQSLLDDRIESIPPTPHSKPTSLPVQESQEQGEETKAKSAQSDDPGQEGGQVSPPPGLFRPTSNPAKVLAQCAELLGKRYHPSSSDKGHLERQDAAQKAIDQGTWQAWRQSLWDVLVTAENCEKAIREQCFAVAGFGRGFRDEGPRRRDVAKSASPPAERFPRYKNAQERSDEMWAKISDEMYAEEEAENG